MTSPHPRPSPKTSLKSLTMSKLFGNYKTTFKFLFRFISLAFADKRFYEAFLTPQKYDETLDKKNCIFLRLFLRLRRCFES